MKVYRRIEITALHRRVIISSGPSMDGPLREITLRKDLKDEAIDPQSTEGRRALTEAVSILHEQLAAMETGEMEQKTNT